MKDMTMHIMQQKGLRGFYRGYWATVLRDVPAYGAFFFIYEYLQRHLISHKDSDLMVNFKRLAFGGIAGVINWMITYPPDLIKSII